MIFFHGRSKRKQNKMSEMIIEHPIIIIETLLKMGQGDEGRLLYLRKSLTNGKTIYESDKKYLKKMYDKLQQNQDAINLLQTDSKIKIETKNEQNLLSKNSQLDINKKFNVVDGSKYDVFEFEIQNFRNSIENLKKKDSQIKDNLALVTLNREILVQRDLDKSNTYGKFSNLPKKSPSDLFDMLAAKPILKKSSFSIPKYSLMTYASAGLFSLWFGGYQNLINLGYFQDLLLGLSAGSAVSAGLFYKKEKNLK